MEAKLKDVLEEDEKLLVKDMSNIDIGTPISELTLKQLAKIGKELFYSRNPAGSAARYAISVITQRCEVKNIQIF